MFGAAGRQRLIGQTMTVGQHQELLVQRIFVHGSVRRQAVIERQSRQQRLVEQRNFGDFGRVGRRGQQNGIEPVVA